MRARSQESGVEEKQKIKSYRDLIVWQKAHELAKLTLQNTNKQFPPTDEARIVKRQLVRSVLSVPANIAEGYGGQKGAAYRNYLIIARRSLSESDYWLFLSLDIGYLSQRSYDQAISLAKETRAMLSALIDKLDVSSCSESRAEYLIPLDS
jgi:four helix bundle protein